MFDVIMPSSLAARRQFPVETLGAGSATVLCKTVLCKLVVQFSDGGTVQDGTMTVAQCNMVQ